MALIRLVEVVLNEEHFITTRSDRVTTEELLLSKNESATIVATASQ
jgi:hypothetical protein